MHLRVRISDPLPRGSRPTFSFAVKDRRPGRLNQPKTKAPRRLTASPALRCSPQPLVLLDHWHRRRVATLAFASLAGGCLGLAVSVLKSSNR